MLDVKIMLEVIEQTESGLKNINSKLGFFLQRLETLAAQHRRKSAPRDLTFQEEFRAGVLELRVLADGAQDFWQRTRFDYQAVNKKDFVFENRAVVKQIKAAALAFSRQSDELYTNYKNLSITGRELPYRLNWWVFESACRDLDKITGHILFMLRDMEKYYDRQ
ncbi:MAG: hypothetical protein LBR90_02255 [Elusimicrobiota bacterium]|jgi:hypothetical protein|nr:hypothetical protein [Elusimicrobiota bacterium]